MVHALQILSVVARHFCRISRGLSVFMASEVSAVGGNQSMEELRRELAEAREQHAATADILRVISSAPMEPQRVFAEIAASAARLCDANATILQVKCGELRVVGQQGPIPTIESVGQRTLPLARDNLIARAVLDRETIQVADLQALGTEYPGSSENARRQGYRSMLAVPLIRAGEAIGAISIRRTEVRPFTDRQIELLKTFADQAVIAIENTRLFEAEQASKRELQESLEYQTATSEVLSVISRSPTDVQPVFDTIVMSCKRLFSSHTAVVTRVSEGKVQLAAFTPVSAEADQELKRYYPIELDGKSAVPSAAREGVPFMITDTEMDAHIPNVELARRRGYRSVLVVPMLSQGATIGTINVSRADPGQFSKPEFELLKTFADQAVIAIENARLFEEVQTRTKELQDSLDRQTATSEVLGVISRSPNEVQPVLDTIVATAHRLCQADRAIVWRLEGETFRAVAHRGLPKEQVEPVYDARLPLSRGSMVGRATLARRAVQVEDVATDPELVAATHALDRDRAGNSHTILAVPLLLKGHPIGVITLGRTRVALFDDKQVALVESFADQAVIAIENSRLFEAEQASKHELTEALEQQTATADVLKVISRSALDVQKVLDSIAATAARLCESADAQVWRVQGGRLVMVAQHGTLKVAPTPLTRGTVTGRAVIDQKAIHVHDLAALVDTEYPDAKGAQAMVGHRTTLATPLVSRGESLGAILVRKMQVDPFSDKQIVLLQTFADQAVIAIENTRLFEAEQASKRELTEALQQQTATADVLKVISRSALDVQKVLDALVESAARLCNAYDAAIGQVVGDGLRLAAHHGPIPYPGPVGQLTFPLERGLIGGRAIIDRRTIHVADILAEPDEYHENRQLALQHGFRTALAIPLLHAGEAIGVISIRRAEVRPFTERQIELVNTFADQAVIAIENTRLFEEVQARTRELQESLEYQTATS